MAKKRADIETNLNWLAWECMKHLGHPRKVKLVCYGGDRIGRIVASEIDPDFKSDREDQGRTRSSLTWILDTGERVPHVRVTAVERML